MNFRLAVPVLLALLPLQVVAQELQVHGYLDARWQANTSDERAWVDGGTGKARYGEGDNALQPGGGALLAHWQATPALSAVATVQWQPRSSPSLGLLEAYLRFRPVSTTPWRWSARIGEFFPPISLENDAVGWTSPWTLTPSAINSWVGEELRSFGVEFRVERRGASGTFELGVAGFRNNDPAGELLASRGWSMGDITSAFNTRLREPDAYAAVARTTSPVRFNPFVENDGRTGWHADASWHNDYGAHLSLMHYDNRADPQSFGVQRGRHVYSWRTRFSAVGAILPVGSMTLLAQFMGGSTAFEPVEGLYLDTRFHAGYLLAGWDRGAWRPALRVDVFSLRQTPDFLTAPLSEHGRALTAALGWRPRPWLRLSAEMLRIDSVRQQRVADGLAARQSDTQLQLSARLLF